MEKKTLRIPAIVLAVGLALAIVVCLLTNIVWSPAVTEHDFHYSVTYKLCGETKTLEGVYTCRLEGSAPGEDPNNRYYTEEYTVNGETTLSHTYTIAQKDGAELYIVTLLNDCYLMNDTKNTGYEPFLEEPVLEALDKEGYPYDETNMPSEFEAEIVSWEYPEPIENKYRFGGFSLMHTGSLLAMLAVGLLTILACMIFVRKDKTLRYNALDVISIVMNFVICILGIPFITITSALFQITIDTAGVLYQVYMCVPAITAFAVAASIALRRMGFRKTGFFLQFIGPVLYFVPMLIELIWTAA